MFRPGIAIVAVALTFTPNASAAQPPLRIDGAGPGAHAGTAAAGVGDVNGDGRPDIAVSSPLGASGFPSCAGTVHVLTGPFAPGVADLAQPLAGLTITGARCREYAGDSVAPAGDVNGDGLGDLVGRDKSDGNLYLIPRQGDGFAPRRLIAPGFDRYDMVG